MDFGKRLKQLRLERGYTQQALGSAIGVSVVTIGNWENGVKKPSLDALLAISSSLDISIDTLLGISAGSRLSRPEQELLADFNALDEHGKQVVRTVCSLEKERIDKLSERSAMKRIRSRKKIKSETRRIPRYTTPSAAGYAAPMDGVDFEMIPVTDEVPASADYAVNIQGDSMEPYIHDGDMVYVQKDAELDIGDVGIFSVDGSMYCKQYYVDEEHNLKLLSANPALRRSNVYVSADSGSFVKCCGKVLLGRKIPLPDYMFEDE